MFPGRRYPSRLTAWCSKSPVHKSEGTDLTFYQVDRSADFMLMPDEHALLLRYCDDHPVAVCPRCSEALTFQRIGADLIMGRRDFCPICRADLTTVLRQHLAECTLMRVQARETGARSREIRQEVPEAWSGARSSEITPMGSCVKPGTQSDTAAARD
jgi:hypothetical protein